MQNDKNINEFLALVYAPPAYFNKMSIAELRTDANRVQILLLTCNNITSAEREQLHAYYMTYANRIKLLNKQYSK